jgi:hypothetical protein
MYVFHVVCHSSEPEQISMLSIILMPTLPTLLKQKRGFRLDFGFVEGPEPDDE